MGKMNKFSKKQKSFFAAAAVCCLLFLIGGAKFADREQLTLRSEYSKEASAISNYCGGEKCDTSNWGSLAAENPLWLIEASQNH
jgi:hypothetical protein